MSFNKMNVSYHYILAYIILPYTDYFWRLKSILEIKTIYRNIDCGLFIMLKITSYKL